MTKEQAQVILLEEMLHDARSKIIFLHSCLTLPGYEYKYPEMTVQAIKQMDQMVPRRTYCIHSVYTDWCISCKHKHERWMLIQEAEQTLGNGSSQLTIIPDE